jgi:glycerol-3-phosphate acyltransferase PlsY
MFSPWLGFKGGKGVATGLGAALGLWPVVTLPGVVCGLVWVGVAKATGYVGLSSIVAAALLPVLTVGFAIVGFEMKPGQVAVFGGLTSLLALLVIWRHRGNLARLRAGTEPKAKWTGKA